MVTESDRIRAEIERTRAELSHDVSTLADRTSPKRIVGRRWDSVKGKTTSLRHRVMGVTGDAKEAVSDKASDVADAVRGAPETVARQTQGSPVAAGLIAFGVGLLAAGVIPESEPERRLATQLADRAEGVMEPVRSVARDIGSDVQESTRVAAAEVVETAKEGAARTTDQVKQSGQAARDEIQR